MSPLSMALFCLPLVLATPAFLEERENGCIALCGQCPCPSSRASSPTPPPPVTSAPPPATTPPPAAPSYGCLHAADPDGAQGYCPAVGATGWCVCSDSSTYGITSGDNPCAYTAPPATGPTTLASTSCSNTTSPVASTTSPSTAAPSVSGAPDDQVSCPVPLKDGTFQYFTKPYIPGNIIDIINNGKKGSYPKTFNPRNPKAGQFNWDLNDCGTRQTAGETINELPMYLDSASNEAYWSTNTDNNPGPYREYYILKDKVATYCGAYAHKDKSSNGDFVACT